MNVILTKFSNSNFTVNFILINTLIAINSNFEYIEVFQSFNFLFIYL